MGLYSNITYLNFNYSDFNNTNKTNSKNEELVYINSIIPPVNLFEKEKGEKFLENYYDCLQLKGQIHKYWNSTNETIDNYKSDFNEEYYDILIREYNNKNIKQISTIKGFDTFCDTCLSIFYDKDNFYILDKIEKYGKNLTEIKLLCQRYLYDHHIHVLDKAYKKTNEGLKQIALLKKIINWMEVREQQNNNFAADYMEPKFVLYSGNDSNVVEIQYVLNKIFNIDLEYPEFGYTQLFELRKYENLFYVEVYYNNRLKMNITYELFKEKIGKIIISNKSIFKLCDTNNNQLNNIRLVLGIFAIVLFVIFVGIILNIKEKLYILNSFKPMHFAKFFLNKN